MPPPEVQILNLIVLSTRPTHIPRILNTQNQDKPGVSWGVQYLILGESDYSKPPKSQIWSTMDMSGWIIFISMGEDASGK